jgi:RNA polymerase sigma factor (sigma-70 family)
MIWKDPSMDDAEEQFQIAERKQLAAWSQGDRAAGQALVVKYHEPITRFFRSKAPGQAEDLTQRTFLALAEAMGRYSGQATVRAFLYGIARNVLKEFIRSKTVGSRREVDMATQSVADWSPGVATQATARAETRLLLAALQRLPTDFQTLLELYYWEELPLEELGAVFEVPVGTVKSRLHRARQLLRQAVQQSDANTALVESTCSLYARWFEANARLR